MVRSHWAKVTAAAAALALATAGCGGKSWSAVVTDASGRPLDGVELTLEPVTSERGLHETVERFRTGQTTDGWHFVTDSHGRAQLSGLPHGYYGVSGYTEPYVYTRLSPPTGGQHNRFAPPGEAEIAVPESDPSAPKRSAVQIPGHTLYDYVQATPLAVFISTRAFRGYVGELQANEPTGRLEIRVGDRGVPDAHAS